MTREQRAKQFMPFDAMKGLQEALRDREERHTRTERHDVGEEQAEKNSASPRALKKGDEVELEYYRACHNGLFRRPQTGLASPVRASTASPSA